MARAPKSTKSGAKDNLADPKAKKARAPRSSKKWPAQKTERAPRHNDVARVRSAIDEVKKGLKDGLFNHAVATDLMLHVASFLSERRSAMSARSLVPGVGVGQCYEPSGTSNDVSVYDADGFYVETISIDEAHRKRICACDRG